MAHGDLFPTSRESADRAESRLLKTADYEPSTRGQHNAAEYLTNSHASLHAMSMQIS
jgi:hypothetical protein